MLDNYSQIERRVFFKFFSGLAVLIFVFAASLRWIGTHISSDMRNFEYQIPKVQADIINDPVQTIGAVPDVIFFGDSTALNALHPLSAKPLDAISLTKLGGSVIDSKILLDRYLNSNEPPRCAVLMTSYGAFPYHIEKYFWDLTVNSGFYTLQDLSNIYKHSRDNRSTSFSYSRLEFIFKVIQNYNWLGDFRFSDIRSLIFNPEIKASGIRAKNFALQNRGTLPVSQETALKYNLPFYTPSEAHLNEPFKADKLLDYYIQEFFRTLNDKRIHTIVLLPPRALKWKIPSAEKYLSDYSNHLRHLIAPFPFIEDHLAPEWWDLGWHFDGSHLLEPGSIKYTQEKMSLLEKCKKPLESVRQEGDQK